MKTVSITESGLILILALEAFVLTGIRCHELMQCHGKELLIESFTELFDVV